MYQLVLLLLGPTVELAAEVEEDVAYNETCLLVLQSPWQRSAKRNRTWCVRSLVQRLW